MKFNELHQQCRHVFCGYSLHPIQYELFTLITLLDIQ